LDGKVAVVTGAGRMRSIGRPIAVELARAGCDVVLTGTGRSPDRYPDEEKAAGWRDIESVADEFARWAGGRLRW
jgi:NAD(P)-dependent dehydrogenase (short-subunit alcohol dehydrogenase family)